MAAWMMVLLIEPCAAPSKVASGLVINFGPEIELMCEALWSLQNAESLRDCISKN